MLQFLVLAAVFVGTVSLLVGVYVFLNRRELAVASTARRRLQVIDSAERAPTILRDTDVSALPFLNRLLAGRSFTDEIALRLQRAGSGLKPGAFVLMLVLGALVGGLLGNLAGGLVAAVPLALAGFAAPFIWLARKQRKRLRAFETQLPDAIDMLVSAMRAGYSFQAAMHFIGTEAAPPLGPEFARFYDEQRLGVDVRAALIAMQERTDSLDLKMLVTAVLLQRETGGNLAEVLSNITDLMRQRVAVKGQIETLTSEPKISARVLAGLPVVVFLGLSLIDPEFMHPMTATPIGRLLLIYGVLSVIVGYLILVKLADVDF